MPVPASHWMDRVKAAESGKPQHPPVAMSRFEPEPADLIHARNALRYRRSLMQDASQPLLHPHRQLTLHTPLPKRVVFALGMSCLGLLLGYAGSALSSQPLLLAGFGSGLVGILGGCFALATLLDPASRWRAPVDPMDHREDRASEAQIAAMKRAAHADPELAGLIDGWWSDSAPIRKQDVALVLAFQKAKAIAARAQTQLH